MSKRFNIVFVATMLVAVGAFGCSKKPERPIVADDDLAARVAKLEADIDRLQTTIDRLEKRLAGSPIAATAPGNALRPLRERLGAGDPDDREPRPERPAGPSGAQRLQDRLKAGQQRPNESQRPVGQQKGKGRNSECHMMCMEERRLCQERIAGADAAKRPEVMAQCREEAQACRQSCNE